MNTKLQFDCALILIHTYIVNSLFKLGKSSTQVYAIFTILKPSLSGVGFQWHMKTVQICSKRLHSITKIVNTQWRNHLTTSSFSSIHLSPVLFILFFHSILFLFLWEPPACCRLVLRTSAITKMTRHIRSSCYMYGVQASHVGFPWICQI